MKSIQYFSLFSGKRPPPIQGCPEMLEVLMNRCWNKDAQVRPTMNEIVDEMQFYQAYFPPANEPIFPEEPDTNIINKIHNEANEDLETLDSSCYASARDRSDKSEVDNVTKPKNNDLDSAGTEFGPKFATNQQQHPRLNIFNKTVSCIFTHSVEISVIFYHFDFTREINFRDCMFKFKTCHFD